MKPQERRKLLQAAEDYFHSGNAALARLALESLVAADATSSRAFELLGYIHGNAGDLAEAHRCLSKACELPRPSAEAFYYLGVSLLRQRQAEAAIRAFDRALALAGPFFAALHDRGTACAQAGRHASALQSYAQAQRLQPESFDLAFNIGKVHDALRDFDRALASYDRALALEPASAEAWAHRGAVLYDLQRHAEAIDAWERALAIDPQIAFLRGFVLHARLRSGDWSRWQADRDELLARVQRGEPACGPFELLAISGDASLQLAAARAWVADRCTAPPARVGFTGGSRGRLRIGYFSADFGRHAVAYLIAELIERHDRERFEVHGFALAPAAPEDPMRARLARAFDRLHEIHACTDAQAPELARGVALDIAIDLGGHTKGGRTSLFSQRLAPVQVNFLGYPGTMGADFIDYIIADEVTLPKASWDACTEKVVHLPECFQPSDTRKALPEADPPRRAFGLPDEGFVFCCFNNTYKINPDIFGTWMRILGAVHGSCLWLLAEGEPARSRLRAEAARAGIAPDRLVFGGRLPLAEYLGRYRLAGLFLDTQPFSAGTTANDALFAGLPVLTELGSSFCGRMAASLLRALDLPELIAGSRTEYEATAIRLASDPAELAALRARLARGREAGPLYDMDRYTRHLEAAYAHMQRHRLSGLPADHIAVPRAA